MIMIIQTLETLENLKWSVAISKVIHMLVLTPLHSLIMAVIVLVNEMQIWKNSAEMENEVKFSILLLFFFQLNNNFLIVFEGEVFLWCYS